MNKFYLLSVMGMLMLLTAAGFQASAQSNTRNITFRGKNTPFVKALDAIRQQGGYEVAADRALLNQAKPLTLSVRDMSVEKFLEIILRDQPLEAKIEDKTIILSRKANLSRISTPDVKEATEVQRMVIIRVLDSDGNPLAGASVTNKNDKRTVMANTEGLCTINADKGDVLEVTFVGYEHKYVVITEKSGLITVKLKLAASELDEAVVIGYGTTTKRFNTGNVATITSADIEKQPVMNPLAALQGMVPGLQVQMVSGYSSAPIKVEIRGRNSLNPQALTEPLYVIDGIPQTTLAMPGSESNANGVSAGVIQAGTSYTGGQSVLFNINPRDIESISVLKDGDATAIYGSRAANGVILITTKKGHTGRTSLDVNVEQGLVTVPRYPELLSTQQYLAMRREAFKNDVITPTIANAPDLVLWDNNRSTDWVRELAGTGHHTSVSGSLSGGDQRNNFRLSGSYTDRVDLNTQSGGNTRATAALNTRHTSANKKLNMDVMVSYAYSKVDVIRATDAALTPPNAPPIYDAEGNLNYAEWEAAPTVSYPFGYLLRPNLQSTQTLNSSMTVQYTLAKGLMVSGRGQFSSNNNTNDVFTPIVSLNPILNPTGETRRGTTKVNNIAFEPEIRYNTVLGKGRLNTFVGASIQSANTKGFNVYGRGYTNDDLLESINHASTVVNTEGYSEYRYAAIFGRITYNWDSKYVVNINGRRDGSSRFAPGKQFGNFGSLGLAWIASEENWMQKALPRWLSFVKLRGSYAITGSDAVGDYEYLPRYDTSVSGNPLYPYNGIQPYVPIIPANQQYQWESLKSLEGALALGFVDNRINLEMSWYQKRSSNQLTRIPTPIYTGFSGVTGNWVATVQNRGLEAEVSARLIDKRDLKFNLTFTIGENSNKLVAYPGIEQSPYATRYKVGASLNTKYYLNLLGVDPMTGVYVFEDYDKNGRVDRKSDVFPGTGGDDQYVAFDMNPRFQGGLVTNLRWKNYGISFNFYFINQLGPHPFFGVRLGSMKNFIVPKEMLEDHWQKPGDNAKYARYTTGTNTAPVSPVDASFIRLNNVDFSYDLPGKLARKVGMQNARFSLRAQNLWTITAYSNDPEIQSGVFNPVPRVMVGSLSFTF